MIEMMPSQNDGVAMPPIASVRTTTSIQVFCFSAEMVPRGMAIRMAITVASRAISSEIGSRVTISSDTGLPDHIEVPKSNRKNPQTKLRNCTISGRSRPISAWQRSMARGSNEPPPEPRRTTQISPGIRRIRMNTSAAAPISVGITSRTRFAMYWYISSVPRPVLRGGGAGPPCDGTRETRFRQPFGASSSQMSDRSWLM